MKHKVGHFAGITYSPLPAALAPFFGVVHPIGRHIIQFLCTNGGVPPFITGRTTKSESVSIQCHRFDMSWDFQSGFHNAEIHNLPDNCEFQRMKCCSILQSAPVTGATFSGLCDLHDSI